MANAGRHHPIVLGYLQAAGCHIGGSRTDMALFGQRMGGIVALGVRWSFILGAGVCR